MKVVRHQEIHETGIEQGTPYYGALPGIFGSQSLSIFLFELCFVAVAKLCFKATEELQRPPYDAAMSQQYSVASSATLRVVSRLHSYVILCLRCYVVRFCTDIGAPTSVAATLTVFLAWATHYTKNPYSKTVGSTADTVQRDKHENSLMRVKSCWRFNWDTDRCPKEGCFKALSKWNLSHRGMLQHIRVRRFRDLLFACGILCGCIVT
jgi:hypothetical protein